MKKYLFLLLIIAVVIACNKTTTLAPYTPPVSKNLIVSSFEHTADSVNVGDTIYLNAAGTIYDTLALYGYFSIVSSAPGSPTYVYGTSSAPIKLSTVLGSMNPAATNTFTSTIRIIGVTSAPNTNLTITGNFVYQLSLSSQGANTASAPDAGQTTKTIYIR